MPADLLGHARRGQGGDQGSGVAGSGDAHGQALLLGRVPAAGQGEGHDEAGAGDAEQEPEAQHLGVAPGSQPSPPQRDQGEAERRETGAAGSETIDQRAQDQPEHRAAKRGHGHHQPLLERRQLEVGGDRGPEGPEEHPDHERHVEVEEGGDQAGGVPRTARL